MQNSLPDYPVPPGETLRETLGALGMSQSELAKRMARPLKTINEIIKGKTAITAATALQLEKVLGVPSAFWLNLESNYQMVKARAVAQARLVQESHHASLFPYSEMSKWGWVKNTRKPIERASELLRFFGVVSFDNIEYAQGIAYRKARGKTPKKESLAAWLRAGELEARQATTSEYHPAKFKALLGELKSLTLDSMIDFAGELHDRCAECGVAIAYIPHLKGTYVNGATRWLTPNKALIQLSIRNRWADIFWFSFFHEAAHILLHGKTDRFIDLDHQEKSDKEIQADRWAANFLLPSAKYRDFCQSQLISRNTVVEFAEECDVSPGIVVGRLQHDALIPYSDLNGLRRQLDWRP